MINLRDQRKKRFSSPIHSIHYRPPMANLPGTSGIMTRETEVMSCENPKMGFANLQILFPSSGRG